MYTIKKVAEISGVTTRTLRYYDEIGLLKPHTVNENGYRMYDDHNLDQLQIILFYRSLEFPLETIKHILQNNDDKEAIFIEQRQLLLDKQKHISKLIETIDKTLLHQKGAIQMTEQEKFEAFKKKTLNEQEEKYGTELRDKYDAKVIETSQQHFKHLSKAQYDKAMAAEVALIDELNTLLSQNISDLDHSIAKSAFHHHKNWLEIMSGMYSASYHQNLALMYIADERFSDYYNSKTTEDSVQLLSDIIIHHTT